MTGQTDARDAPPLPAPTGWERAVDRLLLGAARMGGLIAGSIVARDRGASAEVDAQRRADRRETLRLGVEAGLARCRDAGREPRPDEMVEELEKALDAMDAFHAEHDALIAAQDVERRRRLVQRTRRAGRTGILVGLALLVAALAVGVLNGPAGR